MRVVCLRGGFGLDRLTLEERPRPLPRPGEVLLRVRVAALNFRDVSLARGSYDPKLALPRVLGSDATCEVVERGDGATRFELGERVCPIIAPGWHDGPPTRETTRRMLGGAVDGTLSEFIVANEADLVRPPEHLTDDEAATLGCAGVTAYRALFEFGRLSAGQRVLVLGTGGVSSFALLLARAAGAWVSVASRDAGKLERALSLGARHGVDTTRVREFGLAVRDATGGDGVDVVIEVGGAATLAQSLRAVRAGGTIALIGHAPGSNETPSLLPVVMREIRVQGVLVGPRSSFEALCELMGASELRPIVERVFAFEEFRAAFEHQADGAPFGKVCLRVAR